MIINFNTNIKNKYFANRLIKNILTLITGNTIVSIIGLLNTILILRAIGIEGNGILAIVVGYVGIFNGLFNFQSYNAMIKFGSDALENKNIYKFKQYIKQAFLQDILTALLAFFIGYISVQYISIFFKWDVNTIKYIKIYLITVLFNITGSIGAFIRLNNDFKVLAKISVITSIIKTIALLIGISLKLNFIYYLWLEVFIIVITNIMSFFASIKYLKALECMDFWKVSIGFDREFTMFNLYNNIVSTIDMPVGELTPLIINKLLGVSEVGMYSVIKKIGTLASKVTDPVSQSLFPELSAMVSKKNINEAYRLVKRIFTYTASIGIIGTIITLLTGKLWINIFIPDTLSNIILVSFYILYITVTSSVSGIHLLFISLNMVRYNLPIVFSCNLLYLILLYVLALSWGLMGVIVALILQATLIALCKYVIMKKGFRNI